MKYTHNNWHTPETKQAFGFLYQNRDNTDCWEDILNAEFNKEDAKDLAAKALLKSTVNQHKVDFDQLVEQILSL